MIGLGDRRWTDEAPRSRHRAHRFDPRHTGDGTPGAREVAYHGVPWEESYGYAQAVRVGDVIHVSGQMSHDEDGTFVAPATLDTQGHPSDFAAMERQIRGIYANASRVLATFGATLDDVVEETLFVLDVPTAFEAAATVRKEVYGTPRPRVASNLVGVTRLAFAEQLAEIAFVAVLGNPRPEG